MAWKSPGKLSIRKSRKILSVWHVSAEIIKLTAATLRFLRTLLKANQAEILGFPRRRCTIWEISTMRIYDEDQIYLYACVNLTIKYDVKSEFTRIF